MLFPGIFADGLQFAGRVESPGFLVGRHAGEFPNRQLLGEAHPGGNGAIRRGWRPATTIEEATASSVGRGGITGIGGAHFIKVVAGAAIRTSLEDGNEAVVVDTATLGRRRGRRKVVVGLVGGRTSLDVIIKKDTVILIHAYFNFVSI